jgi:hypothetical protein
MVSTFDAIISPRFIQQGKLPGKDDVMPYLHLFPHADGNYRDVVYKAHNLIQSQKNSEKKAKNASS